MSIQDIYNNSKKNFLFNNSKEFSALRKNLLNNFVITPKIKKNNESLKHLDPHILDFSYKYKNISNKIFYENNENNEDNEDNEDNKISTVLKIWQT